MALDDVCRRRCPSGSHKKQVRWSSSAYWATAESLQCHACCWQIGSESRGAIWGRDSHGSALNRWRGWGFA